LKMRKRRQTMATIEADTIKALQDRQMEEAQLPDSEVIETEETAEEERTMPGIGRHQRAELTTFDEVEDRTYELLTARKSAVMRVCGLAATLLLKKS
jgi:hypothetical protein